MTFQEYCLQKKIDYQQLNQAEPVLCAQLEKEFEQLHPESFTMQKKFLINPLRRKYQLR